MDQEFKIMKALMKDNQTLESDTSLVGLGCESPSPLGTRTLPSKLCPAHFGHK